MKVLVLGHHPSFMSNGTALPQMAGYEDLVLGTFAGHIHVTASTILRSRFTQVGAVSQGGTRDNGFYAGSLQVRKAAISATAEGDGGSDDIAAVAGAAASGMASGAFGIMDLSERRDWVRWGGARGDFPESESWKCCG